MISLQALLANALVTIGNSTELALIGKASLVLCTGLLAARLLTRARASVRHVLLAATFVTLLALPIAAAMMPGVVLEIAAGQKAQPSFEGTTATGSTSVAEPSAVPVSAAAATDVVALPGLADLARIVWGIGVLSVLAYTFAGLWSVGRMQRQGIPALGPQAAADALVREIGVHRSVAVMTHEQAVAPLTCGVRRAAIVLPVDAAVWPTEALRRALVHELEHARRFDWPVQILARVTCALYWFHPLAWVAWRSLRLEAERACDDAVVRSSNNADYAEQLVGLARRLTGAGPRLSLAMAGRSDLSARVSALLDSRQRRGRAGAGAVCAAALASMLLVAGIAPVTAVAAIDRPEPSLTELLTSDGFQSAARPGERSLFNASRRGDLERMRELIDAGADVNEALDGDGSPLIGAARAGHLAATKLLLDRGADPNLAVEGDGNPLIMAAHEGHRDVVALLLDRGAHVDQVVPSDETALIQASGSGQVEVVKLLLARGADVNLRVRVEDSVDRPDGEWRTPLGMARRGNHRAVVALLLAAGARE